MSQPTPSLSPQPPGVFARIRQVLADRELSWNDLWVWYVRLLAVQSLLRGFAEWAVICGFVGPAAGSFEAEPVPVFMLTSLIAVLALVAGTGLWMLTSWGAVTWMISVFVLVIVDLGHWAGWLNFGPDFGRGLLVTLSDIGLVLGYFVVTARAALTKPST